MAGEKGPSDVVSTVVAASHLSDESLNATDVEYGEVFKKRVIRKVDIWLVGFYSLVYIFRVIDSSNYSNAAIINLEQGTNIKKQLHLDPKQWAWTLSIFSYSYLFFEPTNTLLLKKFRPSRWMFVLILAWGICATSVAAVQDFNGMMGVRFAIGVAEAGFFPAVLYHMAFWYTPKEMPWRIAAFYSVGQLSSALSGLLAYAIGFMNGLSGLAGWRWLFLLEGLPAILLSVIALFGLPDYPETAHMLNDKERAFLLERLSSVAPSGKTGSWDFRSLKVLFSDPTTYTFSIYWIGHGIGGFGIAYALPTVIYELGFTTTSLSQLMNIVSHGALLSIEPETYHYCSLPTSHASYSSTPQDMLYNGSGFGHGSALSLVSSSSSLPQMMLNCINSRGHDHCLLYHPGDRVQCGDQVPGPHRRSLLCRICLSSNLARANPCA